MSKEHHCIRCGACCRWEGPVRVSEPEIDAIAAYLQIPVKDFIREHTVLTSDRRSLSLLENPDGSCCYYDPEKHLCKIQPVKPKQCRDFPEKWNFPGWEKLCAGAGRQCPEYPVYRGPVKLMALLVLALGSVPCLKELKILPLFQGNLSPEGFSGWWKAWLQSGEGIGMILMPLAIVLLILIQILAKLKRKTRYVIWFTAMFFLLVSIVFLLRNFPALVQFNALVVALGGVALWLSRPLSVQ